jgi:hypothetical protein
VDKLLAIATTAECCFDAGIKVLPLADGTAQNNQNLAVNASISFPHF